MKRIVMENALRVNENSELVPCSLLVEEGIIAGINGSWEKDANTVIIDAKGLVLSPGFIDLHVHLREPGGEGKETIRTGARAALRGGFTQIFAMPNTQPTPDTPERLRDLQERARKDAPITIGFYAPITKGEKGEELVDLEVLTQAGAAAFSDDGKGVQSAGMMYRAMLNAQKLGKVLAAHCEEDSLLFGGYIHQGEYSKAHGHRGIHPLVEDLQIQRDIALSEATQCPYHICHMSTSKGVSMLGEAKKSSVPVTGEVTPHHLLLTEKDLQEDGDYKMNPPLRSERDRQALIQGLRDGIIDAIATDHAPHDEESKSRGLEGSAFGVVGLETAFPLLYTHLVLPGELPLKRLLDALTSGPAKVMGLETGRLEVGSPADLVLLDLEKTWNIEKKNFESKGKNTPFEGYSVKGQVHTVLAKGQIVMQGGQIID